LQRPWLASVPRGRPSAESLRLGPFSAPLRWPIDGAAPVWGTGSGLNYPEDMKKAANPAGNQGIVSLRADVPLALHDAMRGFIESHPHWDQYRLFQAALAGFLVQQGLDDRAVTRWYLA